jgi:hypothetical protein
MRSWMLLWLMEILSLKTSEDQVYKVLFKGYTTLQISCLWYLYLVVSLELPKVVWEEEPEDKLVDPNKKSLKSLKMFQSGSMMSLAWKKARDKFSK